MVDVQHERIHCQLENPDPMRLNLQDLTLWWDYVQWLLLPPEGKTLAESTAGLVAQVFTEDIHNVAHLPYMPPHDIPHEDDDMMDG